MEKRPRPADGAWATMKMVRAISAGDLAAVRALIAAKAPVGGSRAGGGSALISPLHSAIAREEVAIARALLAAKAAVDLRVDGGATPLHVAASGRNPKVGALLLAAKADPNAATDCGATPLGASLKFSAQSGHVLAEELLRRKADPGRASNLGLPLSVAARSDGSAAVRGMELLLAAKADPDGEGGDPLRTAVARGHPAAVALLLRHKADPNPEAGELPLSLAAEGGGRGHAEVLALLLRHKADPNPEAGQPPLSLAAAGGYAEAVELLLRHKASPARGSLDPLHLAALHGYAPVAEVLLRHKADPDGSRRSGNDPPLTVACGWNRDPVGVVEALLRAKADANLSRGVNGYTPLHAAAGGKCLGSISLLLRHGAEVDQADINGCTPLHMAALRGTGSDEQYGAVAALLGAGADPALPARRGAWSSVISQLRKQLAAPATHPCWGVHAAAFYRMVTAAAPAARRREEYLAGLRRARAELCWRSWARALLRPPAESGTPHDELRDFFAEYPGLRRLVGAKVILFCAA